MTYRRNIQRAELRAGIVAAWAIAVAAQPMGASHLQQMAPFNIIRIMRTIFTCIEGWGVFARCQILSTRHPHPTQNRPPL